MQSANTIAKLALTFSFTSRKSSHQTILPSKEAVPMIAAIVSPAGEELSPGYL
jgi:hypothetical protein